MRFYRHLFVSALIACAAPVFACETQPDISQLPGETAKDAAQRFQKTFADQGVIQKYERESFGLKNASVIYLATVVRLDRGHQGVGLKTSVLPTATVKPLEAIKGSLPKANRELATSGLTSCGDRGDGEATTADIGTIVIVFEGLPKSEWLPNGIDSIRATNARTFELLDPLYPHGKLIANPWDK